MILSLDHVQLAMPVGGEPQARQFYNDLLGFPEVPKPDPLVSRGGCWFAGPGVGIHVGIDPNFVPARKAHPAFRVADLEAWRQQFLQAGVLLTPDETLPHVRRFYVHDPFGNRLEFIQDGDIF